MQYDLILFKWGECKNFGVQKYYSQFCPIKNTKNNTNGLQHINIGPKISGWLIRELCKKNRMKKIEEGMIMMNSYISKPLKAKLKFIAIIEEEIKIRLKELRKYMFGLKKQVETFVVQRKD